MALTISLNDQFTIFNSTKSDLESNGTTSVDSYVNIIEIGLGSVEKSLREETLNCLEFSKGFKTLPTTLLYNERGLQIYEKITYLDEYYLINAEIEILRNFAHEIARVIPSDCMVVELGSGNLRKVKILLNALEEEGKNIDYYALDLSRKELHRTLAQLPPFKHVRCHGLCGSYDDGLHWLKLSENQSRPKCIISLGSSIGNFRRRDAEIFLSGFSKILRPTDLILIGLDNTHDAAKIYQAYNDRENITHSFILNGLQNANEILGENVFKPDEWNVIGEFVYDEEGARHQALLTPTRDFQYKGFLKAGERIEIERSLKYSDEDASRLWKNSGLIESKRWCSSSEAYSLYHLTRSDMNLSMDHMNPLAYAASKIPTLEEWTSLWSLWKTVTRQMIAEKDLYEKPIELRLPYIFYLGHIPTFLDLQISKETEEPLSQTKEFARIFERGIDPDVDDPSSCHRHSEIPDVWPTVNQILEYQNQVHEKVRNLYKIQKTIPCNLSHALWIGFEHEIMHLETILYMLVQSEKTPSPPPGAFPEFRTEARKAKAARVPNQWFRIPSQKITVGLDDQVDNPSCNTPFGWDNEKPSRSFDVPTFEAQARPITNQDYAYYLDKNKILKIPASWAVKPKSDHNTSGGLDFRTGEILNHSLTVLGDLSVESETDAYVPLSKEFLEDKYVKTVYGPIPLKYALDWPAIASYDEFSGYARWMNARIPTFEEARSIYNYSNATRIKDHEPNHVGKKYQAVNGHSKKNGAKETYSPQSLRSSDIQDYFINLDNANIGFKNWHPMPVTSKGNVLAGQSEMGGVWEWTSSVLEKYEGFEPMKNYPEYTADFFDGKHNIVLGGSWATHPRIAGRKSFINWYQRNYDYAWVGARLVRDIKSISD